MQKNNVIFFGTPKIAATCLQALIDQKINVVAVITKPDKLIGRKKVISFSEVKKKAIIHNIPVFQPDKLDLILNDLKLLKPDLILSCAYGKIVPKSILDLPKYKCVNIHTSLLPKYRGGAPIHYAVINNEKETGVSFIYMTNELDAGNILFQQKIKLDHNETYISLYQKMEKVAYEMICKNIKNLFSSSIKSIIQDPSKVTLCKNISRYDEKINWLMSSNQIDCKIRGLFDNPIAYTTYENIEIKIYEAEKCFENDSNSKPGTILKIDKKGILVNAIDGSILFKKIQLPSKKPLKISEIINGKHPFLVKKHFD